jgi:hypothetical protein
LVVQGVGTGAPASHLVLGAQAGVAPPVHSSCVWVRQIIVAPQSAAVVQVAAMQIPVIAAPASTGAGSTIGQGVVPAHAELDRPGAPSDSCSQKKPFPQSAVVLHVFCARAAGAARSTAAKQPTGKRIFVSDMDSPFAGKARRPTGQTHRPLSVVPATCQRRNRAISRVRATLESVS